MKLPGSNPMAWSRVPPKVVRPVPPCRFFTSPRPFSASLKDFRVPTVSPSPDDDQADLAQIEARLGVTA
jgi:hypothetical protein